MRERNEFLIGRLVLQHNTTIHVRYNIMCLFWVMVIFFGMVVPNLQKVSINKIATPYFGNRHFMTPLPPIHPTPFQQAKIVLELSFLDRINLSSTCNSLHFGHQKCYDPPYFSFQNFMTPNIFGTPLLHSKENDNSLRYWMTLHSEIDTYFARSILNVILFILDGNQLCKGDVSRTGSMVICKCNEMSIIYNWMLYAGENHVMICCGQKQVM